MEGDIVAKKIVRGKVKSIKQRGSGGKLLPWESREIFNKPVDVGEESQLSSMTVGQDERNVSHLQQSPPSSRGRQRKKSQGQSSPSSSAWRRLKSLDIVGFNMGAEGHFVQWLAAKIASEEYQAVSLGWVYSNAAFELDVSIETIKRYIGKYTADAAPFRSDGKVITFREGE